MGTKIIRRYRRRIATKIQQAPIVPIVLTVLLITFIIMMNQNKRLSVAPDSYQPLLELIASVESRGNYNAYFGSASNTSVDFTKMTITEVLQWQKDYVAQGSPSSAVGRYQIIDTTLAELVQTLELAPDQLFDEMIQDRMAMSLLERRGSIAYVNSEINRQEFATNLAKEWASLPRVTGENADKSYYDGDNLNKALVDQEEVFDAIDSIEPLQ